MTFDVTKDLMFELIEEKPKTKVYGVINLQQQSNIGFVKWYPSWRHYCFFPEIDTVYSDRCLIRIGEFVEEINKGHKDKKQGGLNEN